MLFLTNWSLVQGLPDVASNNKCKLNSMYWNVFISYRLINGIACFYVSREETSMYLNMLVNRSIAIKKLCLWFTRLRCKLTQGIDGFTNLCILPLYQRLFLTTGKLVWGLSDVATTNVCKVDSKYWNTIVRYRLMKLLFTRSRGKKHP